MFAAARKNPNAPEAALIGLISDSHGRAGLLADALAFLKQKGCDDIYHLGDICDSLQPETADACVGQLRDFQVRCVKGNNDHTLVVNHGGRQSDAIETRNVEFLKRLPLARALDNGLLAHSLPFEKELGLACMVGAMTDDYARMFFRRFPNRILFRGHSHTPELTRQDRHGCVRSAALPLGRHVAASGLTPCIVTCGALDLGLCLLWSPADGRVISLRF